MGTISSDLPEARAARFFSARFDGEEEKILWCADGLQIRYI